MKRCIIFFFCTSICKGITLFPVGVETGWNTEDFVKIDNPHNPTTSRGNGSVGYVYYVSKKEVSNDQYVFFLNDVAKTNSRFLMSSTSSFKITRSGSSGGYSYSVMSGFGSAAVNGISPAASMMYINWLANYVGNKNTMTGSYNVSLSGEYWQWRVPARNSNASIFLPNRDEALKSMYFNGSLNLWMSNWSNPNGLFNADNIPSEFVEHSKPGEYLIQDALKFTSSGWLGTPVNLTQIEDSLYLNPANMSAYGNVNWVGFTQDNMTDVGFRIATTLSNVPEPSSLSLLLAGGAVLMAGRRRRV
jgi:hypothetical protein